jgi:hypothetical protein
MNPHPGGRVIRTCRNRVSLRDERRFHLREPIHLTAVHVVWLAARVLRNNPDPMNVLEEHHFALPLKRPGEARFSDVVLR